MLKPGSRAVELPAFPSSPPRTRSPRCRCGWSPAGWPAPAARDPGVHRGAARASPGIVSVTMDAGCSPPPSCRAPPAWAQAEGARPGCDAPRERLPQPSPTTKATTALARSLRVWFPWGGDRRRVTTGEGMIVPGRPHAHALTHESSRAAAARPGDSTLPGERCSLRLGERTAHAAPRPARLRPPETASWSRSDRCAWTVRRWLACGERDRPRRGAASDGVAPPSPRLTTPPA
jgi:hypothetical protein